jgi:hypothetical protein
MSDELDLSGAPRRPEVKMTTTTMERPAEMTPTLRGVRPNIVQSIRAFRVSDLQEAAHAAGQHFLYANLGNAQSKQDVLDLIAQQFTFPQHFGKNFDALYDCMTDPLHKSGARAAARHLPGRRRLLGGSEDTVPVLLFFSVARSASTSQAERANEANGTESVPGIEVQGNSDPAAEKMPTDKLVDVSPLALRMSSPFNAGYWLAAA